MQPFNMYKMPTTEGNTRTLFLGSVVAAFGVCKMMYNAVNRNR